MHVGQLLHASQQLKTLASVLLLVKPSRAFRERVERAWITISRELDRLVAEGAQEAAAAAGRRKPKGG
jgi:hypothetical protein